jgi:glucose-1-phosphate adenylyltransferase
MEGETIMKLATTIGEMYAFTQTPAEAVRQYADSGFRCLDYSFYNVAKNPANPFMGENWREQILEAKAAAEELGFTSFSRDVLIRGTEIYRIFGYEYKGYFASIDSMANYYKHSMELLDKEVRDGLFRVSGANIYTSVRDSAPCKIASSATVSNSLIADGCVIEGDVTGSILFRGVKVAKGAVIRNSILFQNTEIGENTRINCVITDRNTKILKGRELSGHETHPSYIPENTII